MHPGSRLSGTEPNEVRNGPGKRDWEADPNRLTGWHDGKAKGKGEAGTGCRSRKLVSPGREDLPAGAVIVGSGSEALRAGGSVFGKRIL